MTTLLVSVFCIGYLFIVLEHATRISKTVAALISGVLIWALIFIFDLPIADAGAKDDTLLHHIGKIAEIIFFLKGAMTIVELIDLHRGFAWINRLVATRSKIKLLWIAGFGSFMLSAILDNLTTTIVIIALLKKLLHVREDRIWFASFVVIAANAGGAWSPIGDVTTTMLWIDHKVSATELVRLLLIPSLCCLLVPLLICSTFKRFKSPLEPQVSAPEQGGELLSSKLMFWTGLAALVFVPVFKTYTHLPPYMGMLLSLAVVWLVSELIHPEEDFNEERRHLYSAQRALSRVDFSSLLFFIGILLAIAGLEAQGILINFASQLDAFLPSKTMTGIFMGVASAVIDNVPLVAAAISMYNEPMDNHFWHLLAYTCGTGGSMLIIGSAAGVAAMGMEEIKFIWYFKHISWIAAVGYLAGIAVFLILW
jgi:Na+/H+ antiporter NhaD/arsenite permease-like protein